MFESLLYDVMLAFFSENNLFSQNLSRFRSSDSCINQLLSITHEILNAFNKGLEVCGIIFDISKTSDYVWHNGLLFKLRQNGISGDIIDILEDFLRNRKQRVVLDGQCSSWVDIRAGVPKRSIPGPLLFLIYIKDNRSKRTVLFKLTIILSLQIIEKERKILRVSTNTVITHNYLIVFIAHKVIKLMT